MAKHRKPYDYAGADVLENFVRRGGFFEQIKSSAIHVYLGLPYLEKRGLGLCGPITADYDKLADAGCVNRSSIGNALDQLDGLLCEVKKGNPIRGGKQATELRRYTIEELRDRKHKTKLIDNTPEHARNLCELLNNRTFAYGDNPVCQPFWTASMVGRVMSSRPHVQNDPENQRSARLLAGCRKNEVLHHIDFRRAEPSIIRAILGDESFSSDLYGTAAEIIGLDMTNPTKKKAVKEKINRLHYAKSSVQQLDFIAEGNAEFKAAFIPYAEALDVAKNRLWSLTASAGRARRVVHTLGGSGIVAKKGKRLHQGQVFNWRVQGTIADIVNAACLKIIEDEPAMGWRLCFPEHDAIYVIGKREHTEAIETIMKNEATRLGIVLKVRCEQFPPVAV